MINNFVKSSIFLFSNFVKIHTEAFPHIEKKTFRNVQLMLRTTVLGHRLPKLHNQVENINISLIIIKL